MLRSAGFVIVISLLLVACGSDDISQTNPVPLQTSIPTAIKDEHDYFRRELTKLSELTDSTGHVAKRLLETVLHHFSEEERYALPSLTLLPLLNSDSIPADAAGYITLTDSLKLQTVHLNVEHQMIKALMDELVAVAQVEGHIEVAELQRELLNHARMEEQVVFPAAMLVGEYLRAKTAITK